MRYRSIWSSRLVRESTGKPIVKFSGKLDVASCFREDYGDDLPYEILVVYFLNNKNEVIGSSVVSKGLVDGSLVHAREVFREAIIKNSSNVVLVHNHPSGNCTPSSADFRISKDMGAAGDILGIRLLDHVVVGENGRCSSAVDILDHLETEDPSVK